MPATDLPASDYRELPPGAALRSHVVCVWTQSIGAGATGYPQRVLPDGCGDLVWVGDRRPVVAGPATRAVVAHLPAGALVVGARFRPGLAPSFLHVPADRLADRTVPLDDIWPRGVGELSERLAAAATVEGKLALLQRVLAVRAAAAPPADALMAAAVDWLACRPAGRIGDLAERLGLSARQLRRRMLPTVGYGPKTLQRILRLQRLLALARRRRGSGGLAGLALAAGYADQAHMTREAAGLAGLRPRALLADADTTLGLSDLFKTGGDGPD